MRKRFLKQHEGRRCALAASCSGNKVITRRAYNYASIVLYGLIVAGSVIMQDTKDVIDKACIDMRMNNQRAEVIKL